MNHHPYPIVEVDDNSLLVLHKRLEKATKSAHCILAFTLTRESWKEKRFPMGGIWGIFCSNSHIGIFD